MGIQSLSLKLIAVLLSTVILSACGGGGGSGDDNPEQTIAPFVELKITTAEKRIWITLNHDNPVLECIAEGRKEGEVAFTTLVKEYFDWSSSDPSIITVGQHGKITAVKEGEAEIILTMHYETYDQVVRQRIVVKPNSDNILPIANAGDDQIVNGGDTVSLNAESSYDYDGEITTWKWEVINGNISIDEISNTNTPVLSFTAPDSKQTQTIELLLTVNDNDGGAKTNTMKVTIHPSGEQSAPTVNLVKPDGIIEGQSVTLIGSFEDIEDTAKRCEWYWSNNAENISNQLISPAIEPCPKQLPALSFIPAPEEIPSDIYITLIVTDWLDQTAHMTQKFIVAKKSAETIMHTVTTNAGDGGTISPESQSVIENETQVFMLVPKDKYGYQLDSDSVTSTCGGTLSGNSYTTNPITKPCTVSANFKLKSYQVKTLVEGDGGSISPNNDQIVTHDSKKTFAIEANEGFRIDVISGCYGVKFSGTNTTINHDYKTGAITGDCTVITTFKPIQHSITTSVTAIGEGVAGTISPEVQLIDHGKGLTFTIKANNGYRIDSIKGCSKTPFEGTVEIEKAYDVKNILNDCEITVGFVQQHKVKGVSGGHGSITPNDHMVDHDQIITLLVKADEGYQIDTIQGCQGYPVENFDNDKITYNYNTGAIVNNCDVIASFKPREFTIGGIVTGFNIGETVKFQLSHNGINYETTSNAATGVFSFDKKIPFDHSIYNVSIISLPETENKTTQNCRFSNSKNSYEFSESNIYGNVILEIICNDLSTLNDTGITKCTNLSESLHPCPQNISPNQDAENGRDSIVLLKKKGRGIAGFDFTFINNQGEIETRSLLARCVIDNNTGLIWELKKDTSDNPQHKDHKYSWYNTNPSSNGGQSGHIGNNTSCGETLEKCNTTKYIEYINSINLCGYNNWRLPIKNELVGVLYNTPTNPKIDINIFSNTTDNPYWTSTPFSLQSSRAMYVDFENGQSGAIDKTTSFPIRLVYSGSDTTKVNSSTQCDNQNEQISASTPTDQFITNSDGTVFDIKTNLTWMKCSIGQHWDGNSCIGSSQLYNWEDALQRIVEINNNPEIYDSAGFADWRIPNKNELASILEDNCWNPSINTHIFPNTSKSNFWSSTPDAQHGSYIYAINFAYGLVLNAGSNNKYNIRIVRGGN